MKKIFFIMAASILSIPMAANAFYLDSSDLKPVLRNNSVIQNQQAGVTMPTRDIKSNMAINPQTVLTNTQTATTTTQIISNTALSALANLDNKIDQTDKSVHKSFVDLVSVLSSKNEAQNVQSQISSILANNSITQASKNNAISQIMTSYASDLVKNKSHLASAVKSMSAVDKSILVKALASLAQGQTDYINLASEYTKEAAGITKASRSMAEVADNLQKIQDTVNTLKSNAQAVQSLISQVSSIAKAGGLNIVK